MLAYARRCPLEEQDGNEPIDFERHRRTLHMYEPHMDEAGRLMVGWLARWRRCPALLPNSMALPRPFLLLEGCASPQFT